MKTTVMKRTVVVPVFGATSGLTVVSFGPDGRRLMMQAEIPWQKKGKKIYWPMDWLRGVLAAIKTLARKGDIVFGAMPGADMVLFDGAGRLALPALHYRCINPNSWKRKLSFDRFDFYHDTGGAAVNFWQPFSQISCGYGDRVFWSDNGISKIHLLNDWMTAQMLGGETVFRDATMAQSQGLLSDRSYRAYDSIPFGFDLLNSLFSDEVCDAYQVFTDERGRLIMPFSHDSPYSRDVGFSCCPFVLWTGSWVGMAIQTNTDPIWDTFEAGFAFEGLGQSRAAVTNTGMFGPIWKEFMCVFNLDYEKAAGFAISNFCNTELNNPLDLGQLPNKPNEAVNQTIVVYGSPFFAMAAFIKAVAAKCVADLKNGAALLNKAEPKEVAITGGWAQNRAFTTAIENLGLKAIIPPFAHEATHAGLAANALVRIGDARDVKEALEMLPH